MNEPKDITLPEPPAGSRWEYRGTGWNTEHATFCYQDLNGRVTRHTSSACGAPGHYWGAVPIESTTPRTDAALMRGGEMIVGFARELETELDAATSECGRLRERLHLFEKECERRGVVAETYRTELDAARGIAEAAEEEVEELRNLLVQCGQAIGKEAYTCDDGTTQQDVLVAKVPELVRRLVEKRDETADLIYDIMRDEVNVIDECEKWLRAYAPEKLREEYEIKPELQDFGLTPIKIDDESRQALDRIAEFVGLSGTTHNFIAAEVVSMIEKMTVKLSYADARQCWPSMKAFDLIKPKPEAAYPPPEYEWPEKPAPPDGCVWVRQPDSGRNVVGDIPLVGPMTDLKWEVENDNRSHWSGTVVFRAEPIDHAQIAKDILQEKLNPAFGNGTFRDTRLDAFVDHVIRAAQTRP